MTRRAPGSSKPRNSRDEPFPAGGGFRLGLQGQKSLLAASDVIVDVLSFSTAVDVAASRGARILPYPYGQADAQGYADNRGAPRTAGGGQLSLSPVTLQTVADGARIVLPSQNGSRLSRETGAVPTPAGCLRNAAAVARALPPLESSIGVVAGELWPDGGLRPAIEDLLGARTDRLGPRRRRGDRDRSGREPHGSVAAGRRLCQRGRNMIREENIEIPCAGGAIPTFAAEPEHPGPAVILLIDAPGIREELRDFARRIARAGCHCLLPDMFHRLGTLRFDLSRRDERMTAVIGAAMASLDHERVAGDSEALLDHLDAHPRVAPGPRGLVGYCMSGQYVLSAACRFADRIGAVAAFHGVGMVTGRADSPHLGAGSIAAELFLGFASDDPLVPDDVIPTLGDVLSRSGVAHRIEVYPQTRHGFSFPSRDVYSRTAAEACWEHMLDLFARRLREPG